MHRMTAILESNQLKERVLPRTKLGLRSEIRTPIQVLLIEDELEHANWTSTLLSGEPDECFLVDCVNSLQEAIKHLASHHVDVILLDLGLPELKGYKSHTVMRLAAPNIPVVILTGDDTKVSRDVVLTAGAMDYLIKGETSVDQLRDALLRAYQNRKKLRT